MDIFGVITLNVIERAWWRPDFSKIHNTKYYYNHSNNNSYFIETLFVIVEYSGANFVHKSKPEKC